MDINSNKIIINELNNINLCDLFGTKKRTINIINLLKTIYDPGFIFYSNTVTNNSVIKFLNTNIYFDRLNFIQDYRNNIECINDPVLFHSNISEEPFSLENIKEIYENKTEYTTFFNLYKISGVKQCIAYHYDSTTTIGTYIAIGFYNKEHTTLDKNLNLLALIAPHINKYLHKKYLASEMLNVKPLTDREHEILLSLKKGNNQVEISKLLNITVRTVRFHLDNIVMKLNAKNKFHALSIALKLNIV